MTDTLENLFYKKNKYLGFLITPSGEINSGQKDLKDRALKAFIKVKKKLGLLFQQVSLVSLKLFDTLVRPILLYASDLWGILKPPKNNVVTTFVTCFANIY